MLHGFVRRSDNFNIYSLSGRLPPFPSPLRLLPNQSRIQSNQLFTRCYIYSISLISSPVWVAAFLAHLSLCMKYCYLELCCFVTFRYKSQSDGSGGTRVFGSARRKDTLKDTEGKRRRWDGEKEHNCQYIAFQSG